MDHIEGEGPWYGTDGQLRFANRANLMTVPRARIQYDEFHRFAEDYALVWSGTGLGGVAAGPDCEGWTRADATVLGRVGSVTEPAAWTDSTEARCDVTAHLYCFER